MKKTLLVFLIGILSSGVSFADDFEKLEAKKNAIDSANPFANKKAECIHKTDKGLELQTNWAFFGHGVYLSTITSASITRKGKYTVESGVLKLAETESVMRTKRTPSDKKIEYKYKIVPDGFQYIHEISPEKQMLYTCKWTGKP